jgi:hypothetical protein
MLATVAGICFVLHVNADAAVDNTLFDFATVTNALVMIGSKRLFSTTVEMFALDSYCHLAGPSCVRLCCRQDSHLDEVRSEDGCLMCSATAAL